MNSVYDIIKTADEAVKQQKSGLTSPLELVSILNDLAMEAHRLGHAPLRRELFRLKREAEEKLELEVICLKHTHV